MTPVPPPAENHPGPTPYEAQVLVHPSRRRITEMLGAAPDGLTVAELAAAIGLHANAIRQHVNTLQGAGLVASQGAVATGLRGRPSRRYRLITTHGVAAAGQRELVRLLLELVQRGGATDDVVEAFGMEQGRRIVPGDDPDAPSVLIGALAGMGFAPEEVTRRADRLAGSLDLRLRACPFQDAVLAEGGPLICVLHRGLVRGALDRVDENAELVAFDAEDPRTAGCRVLIEGLAQGTGAAPATPG